MSEQATLHGKFLAAAERYPERTALEIGGEAIRYAQLRERALRVAARTLGTGRRSPWTATSPWVRSTSRWTVPGRKAPTATHPSVFDTDAPVRAERGR